jgi:Protein of unknown function (DUF4235)
MGRVIFAPIAIIAGLIAGQIAKKAFDLAWSRFSDEEAPRPDQREVGLPQLVGALAVEGATFRVTKGLVDHGTRSGFARMTGSWPGEEGPDPVGEDR